MARAFDDRMIDAYPREGKEGVVVSRLDLFSDDVDDEE